jgi:hypothetical protein
MRRFVLLLTVLACSLAQAAVTGEWRVDQTGSTVATHAGVTPDEAWSKCQKSAPTTSPIRLESTCQGLRHVTIVTPDPIPEPTRVLFADDFASGDLTKAANGFKWLGGNSTEVVSDPGSASGKALRFRFKAAASGSDSFAERRFAIPSLTDVWIQYTVVIPLNYAHRNDTGSDNNKVLRLWYGNKSDGNDGYSSYVIKGGFSTLPSDRLIPEWGPPGVGQRDAPTTSGWITSEDRGKQVTFTFHVKTDTKCTGDPKTTGGNGALEAWKGEKRILSYREACWPSKGASFDRGYAFGWANSGFTQQTDILMRKFSISTTNVYGVQ